MPEFNGADYQSERDRPRLQVQMHRIFDLMQDQSWRTLEEISAATSDPPASVSAQLRHLRKERFGGHTVERKHIGHGLYRYRLVVNGAMNHRPERHVKASTKDVYKLFHEGSLALAEVEHTGMRVDVAYLDEAIRTTTEKIRRAEAKLRKSSVYKVWRREYGDRTNLGSREQLGHVLFDVLGHKHGGYTGKGVKSLDRAAPDGKLGVFSDVGDKKNRNLRYRMDEEVLSKLDIPFARRLLKVEKLKKLNGTYLKGVRREVVGDRVHPVFNLHIVWTGRSSCDTPNLQNIPVREPWIAEIIRTAFIPSPNCRIIENDFKAVEVAFAAVVTKDPVLLDYVRDPSKDMHRDTARKIFFLEDQPKDWWKQKGPGGGADCRYVGKNGVVFPGFYGSDYISIAPAIWVAIEEKKLSVGDVPMKEWLRRHGIKELGDLDRDRSPRKGTLERHVQEFEDWYWNDQYKVFTAWKKKWYSDYLEKGYFETLTGLRYKGIFDRNQVLNGAIQGGAFHWLLWVMTEQVRWIRENEMLSRVICQIHDSMIGDVHKDETDAYLANVKKLVTEGLPKRFPWINVPLTIEAELTPTFEEGGNWHLKKEVKL